MDILRLKRCQTRLQFFSFPSTDKFGAQQTAEFRPATLDAAAAAAAKPATAAGPAATAVEEALRAELVHSNMAVVATGVALSMAQARICALG